MCQNDIWLMIHDYTGKVTSQKPAQSRILRQVPLRWEIYCWHGCQCNTMIYFDTYNKPFLFDRPVLIVITVSRLKIVASLIAQITVQCPLVVIQLLGNFEIPKLHCYLCKKEFSITLLPVKTDSYLYFTVSPVQAMELVLQCDLFQLNQHAAVLQSTL